MMSSDNVNWYWQVVAQDKKDPFPRLGIRACEVSNGATSTSAEERSISPTSPLLTPPSGQDNTDPGPKQNNYRGTRRNARNYNTVKWSLEEKKIIQYCFTYSRCEKWGRLKNTVFEKKIGEANLPPEKLGNTTTAKLRSIVSQMHVYLPQEEIAKIASEAEEQARKDFQSTDEEQKREYERSVWKREDNWLLLWANEYVYTKYAKGRERTAKWRMIFNHHCQNKKDLPTTTLHSQKCNILMKNQFSSEEIDLMKKEVKNMIEKDKCPLKEPIDMPEMIEVQHLKPESVSQEQKHPLLQGRSPRVVLQRVPCKIVGGRRVATSNQSPCEPTSEQQSVRTKAPSVRIPPPEPPDSPPSDSSSESDDSDTPERPRRPRRSHSPPRPPSGIPQEVDEDQRLLEEELANKIEETKEMDMKDRPRLYKLKEDKKFKDLLMKVNKGLTNLIPVNSSITDINHANFGAAWYIQTKVAPHLSEKVKKGARKKITNFEPKWKKKIQKTINQLRAEVAQITSYRNQQHPTRRLIKKIESIKRKYEINNNQIEARLAEHQALIKAHAEQIRSKEKRIYTKQINKQFEENPRNVYRNMSKENIDVQEPPREEEVEGFWRPLFEDPKQHQESEWIEIVKEKNRNKPQMPALEFNEEQIRKKINEYSNFKAPGIDKIPNYWLKKVTSLHPHYALAFTKLQKREVESPEWLTTGLTNLLPKSKETKLPNKYRPICCLTTTYKWLTGIISDAIYDHLTMGNYLEGEQKGCIRNKLGTKDQLLINKTILENCKRRGKNLSIAWIDYKKAFDSVPHSWILRCLELYNVNRELIAFIRSQMSMWNTTISLNHSEGKIVIPDIKIQRGIFQGDSLSPLLFCLTIDPLSKILKDKNIGYDLSEGRSKKSNKKINHLLFMDDLKLFADSDQNLTKLVDEVSKFSKDIKMEFGLDKCSKCTIRKGKKVAAMNIQVDEDSHIEDLAEDTTYKYLGIEENATIEHKKMREKIKKEYLSRLKRICKSYLTPKNKITAVNQLAIPVVTYGFGIVDWPQGDLNYLDIKTRKILTRNKVIYRNQCMDRMYIPRKEGGLGLTEISQAFRSTIVSLGQYLISSTEDIMKTVAHHHREVLSQQTSVIKLAQNFGKELIHDRQGNEAQPATKLAKKTRSQYSKQEEKVRIENWKKHQRACKFPEELEKCYIDKEESLRWLKNGVLGFDGERIIVGAQDQGLLTNGFRKMARLSQSDQCRFCKNAVESSNHLVSGCEILLAEGHYTTRHNKICKYIHWKACKELGIEAADNVWEHKPEPVVANEKITIYYDKIIPTGRYIENGAIKPDIVIWNKEERKAQIIDVTVPNDFGLNRAERGKITKYQDLKNDLRTTWRLKEIDIIPVVIGATGLMKKNLKSYLQAIPGNPSAYEVQIAAIKGTVTILKRALGYCAVGE